MAAFDTNRSFAAAGTPGRTQGFIASLFGAVATWNDARNTRKSLNALSDRELNDIGLVRGDIDDVSARF